MKQQDSKCETQRFTLPRIRLLNLPSAITATALSLAAIGCDSSSEGGGGGSETPATPLTHEESQSLIRSTTQDYSRLLEERLRFLDGDERLIGALDSLFGAEEEVCDVYFSEEGEEITECWSSDEDEDEGGSAIRVDFATEMDEMVSEMLEQLSPETQIAEIAQLTYTMDPQEVCQESVETTEVIRDIDSDAEPDVEPDAEPEITYNQDCLDLMEREQPRLEITRVESGVRAAILMKAGQEELASLSLTNTKARFSLSLDAMSRVIEAMESAFSENEEEGFEGELEEDDFEEDAFDLDLTISGAISFELDLSQADLSRLTFNVDRAISITGTFDTDNEVNFNFPVAEGLMFAELNSANSALKTGLSIPQLSQTLNTSLSGEDWEYDEETGEERRTEAGPVRELVASLGGFDLALDLSLVEEGINAVLEVGLGNESSTVHIDGQQVLKFDLNPNHGRRISFNLNHNQNAVEDMADSFRLALASELHAMKIDLNFSNFEELDLPASIAREIYQVAFTSDGGESPVLELRDEVQVVSGRLEISAEQGGITHVAEGGQCLVETRSSEEEEQVEEEHLLASFEVGTCG